MDGVGGSDLIKWFIGVSVKDKKVVVYFWPYKKLFQHKNILYWKQIRGSKEVFYDILQQMLTKNHNITGNLYHTLMKDPNKVCMN